jgi:septum formation topological specificity factor MinE
MFFPLVAYERAVNSSDAFADLRSNILAVLRKPVA